MDNFAVNIQIVMDQYVAKADHPYPALFELFIDQALSAEQAWQIAACIDFTKSPFGNNMTRHVVDGFDRKLQEAFGAS